MNAYAVEIQASTGYEFKSQTFTIVVDAPQGLRPGRASWNPPCDRTRGRVERRAPGGDHSALDRHERYRVVSIRAHVDDVAVAPATPVVTGQHGGNPRCGSGPERSPGCPRPADETLTVSSGHLPPHSCAHCDQSIR